MTALNLTHCKVGDRAEIDVDVDEAFVDAFVEFSGDRNPLHVDAGYASTTHFGRRVVHGMSYASLFSRLIGMELPGPGALWMSQSFRFTNPAYLGDRLRLTVEILSLSESAGNVTLDCRVVNQLGEEILSGTGEVMLLKSEQVEPSAAAPARRVAIVTGASRGIGAAIARRLAADGVAVALTYRSSRAEAEEVCAGLDEAICIESDASDSAAMRRLHNEVRSRLGAPNILVLNASGRDLHGEAADGDFNRFARHLATQLEGPHALVSASMEGMLSNGGGSIVAIGSTYASATPPAGMAPYVVAKSALAAYIRCLAVDYGHGGVRANLVAPGMTSTSLLAGVTDRARKVAAMQNPMRRLAFPEDVVGAVAFLASPEAAYVNGHTLVVSGGSLML